MKTLFSPVNTERFWSSPHIHCFPRPTSTRPHIMNEGAPSPYDATESHPVQVLLEIVHGGDHIVPCSDADWRILDTELQELEAQRALLAMQQPLSGSVQESTAEFPGVHVRTSYIIPASTRKWVYNTMYRRHAQKQRSNATWRTSDASAACSRMFGNVQQCSAIFSNVQQCSAIVQQLPMFSND
jgi:hypothetical protein